MYDQYNIFGGVDQLKEEQEKPTSPNKYKTMQENFGFKEGETCKTCRHCFKNIWQRTYYKCLLWHMSNSAATDIRLKDKACGKWQPK